MMKKQFKGLKKQAGVSMIEAMGVLLIAGVGVAFALNYYAKASAQQDTTNAIGGLQSLMPKVKNFFGNAGYNGITGKVVNNLSPVLGPLGFDGNNMRDQNGNIMNWTGNASGAAASYVVTYGGNTKALTSESCAQFATGMQSAADVITIGGDTTAVTTTAGQAGGGFTYKTAAGVLDPVKLASGCAEANPVIAIQSH